MLVEIQAGEGGSDSKMFAKDMLSAYVKWCKHRGLKCEVIEETDSRSAMQVTGNGAWSAFEGESGKHCVQRIPPTERSGRKQTSIVAVMTRKIEPDPDVSLRETDLDIGYTTGTGPGGQHRNKTKSAVRAKHKPTGFVVVIDGRDQHANKRMALRILATRVKAHLEARNAERSNESKNAQWGGGSRSNKVRTYNFMESRAVDHVTNRKTNRVDDVIGKGRFDLLIA